MLLAQDMTGIGGAFAHWDKLTILFWLPWPNQTKRNLEEIKWAGSVINVTRQDQRGHGTYNKIEGMSWMKYNCTFEIQIFML